jgi:pyruvate/2-oxoglutarate dehydrogenase complex dihydrolipoamide acyltransferase (E2) component
MFRHLLISILLVAAATAHAQTAATTHPQGQGDASPAAAPAQSQPPTAAPARPQAPPAPAQPQAPATPPSHKQPAPSPTQKQPAPPHPAQGNEIAIGRFSTSELSGWTDQPYKGKTSYTLEDGSLKAHAVKAASGKIRKIKVDLKKYPKLTWSWRIDHTLKREDIKEKAGDDFAARVYVIFPRGVFWRMRAINYVWAAKMPRKSEAPSPYTSNSVIIAVESGDEKAGKWVSEERNVYEDYKRIFGEEPPLVGGVAIMTDTDDTQDEATAWYGDITLHAP